ncbi:hypothetical protein TIFTF001_022303 [Ficus carica]|uniref:BAHD acyltransferase n=1 Tax=Ficus carica TaxID=3494 RepID=A0AA88AJ13_FICCA|nr:hypothetical protein TIFTF001_022303 [Ficus carica]
MEAETTKIEIISRKIIKPSSPTPKNKRKVKLSLIDQTYTPSYVPMILFYNTPSKGYSNSLEKSLSKTLVKFYPFAGRLNGNVSVDCNDEGAYILEARINCDLLDFLQKPDPKLVPQFLPSSNPKNINHALLLAQLTVFSCGGIAIGVSASHKITDGPALSYLIRTWSSMSAGEQDLVPPKIVGPSLFPPPDSPIQRSMPLLQGQVLASRRFVFSLSKLASLKAKIISGGTSIQPKINPTVVEIVSALLFKCAVAASQSPYSVLRQHVNLRKRMSPPLSEDSVGNIIWSILVPFDESDQWELHGIVAKMRKGLTEFFNEKANRFGEDGFSYVCEFLRMEAELAKKGIDVYCFTSVRKRPLYQVDFGWGKPMWVTIPVLNNNMFVLVDTKCGHGVDVWVTLEEKRMARFEKDEELLAFASVNPSTIKTYCRM